MISQVPGSLGGLLGRDQQGPSRLSHARTKVVYLLTHLTCEECGEDPGRNATFTLQESGLRNGGESRGSPKAVVSYQLF